MKCIGAQIPRRSQTEIDRATDILEEYAVDDSQTLTELLLDAKPEQFVALFDEFAAHGEESRESLRQELRRTLKPRWRDSPLAPDWTELPAGLLQSIEQADGMVEERFAFCQAMPMEEFRGVVDQMQLSGYRPIRIRPFQDHDTICVAAAWTRDDRPWRWLLDESSERIFAEDEKQRRDGFAAVDVAGYIDEVDGYPSERFVATWVQMLEDSDDARLFAGVLFDDVKTIYGAFKSSGHQFTHSLQAFRSLNGQRQFCGVLLKFDHPSTLLFNQSSESFAKTDYLNRILWDLDLSRAREKPSPTVRNRQALFAARRLLKETPQSVEARLAVGLASFRLGDEKQAAEQLDGVIESFESASKETGDSGALPAHALDDALRFRAILHARNGNADAARQDLKRLNERNVPTSVKTCTQAIVSAHLNDNSKMELLESLLEGNPQDHSAIYEVACCYSIVSGILDGNNVTLSKVYAERAVTLIRDALESGYLDEERLESDADLDPIRQLNGFKKLLESNGRAVRYAAVWNDSGWLESAVSFGLDPKSHLVKCRELNDNGYRVASISTTWVNGQRVTGSVWYRPLISDADRETLARRQANAAIAALRMGDADQVWPLLKASPDPRLRTWIIHRFSSMEASPETIVQRLKVETDPSIRQALTLILGDAEPIDREALAPLLLAAYQSESDAGIHSAVEWVLRRWGNEAELNEIDRSLASEMPEGDRDWYITKHGYTMVVIPGPVELRMGSPYTEPDRSSLEQLHRKRIGRSFAIASKEVTVAQYQAFRREYPNLGRQVLRKYTPEDNCPQVSVTWFEAAAYCRWLSEKESVGEDEYCYPPIAEIKPGMKLPPDYLRRTGYRLPTEAEWEYACRANTITSRYYGDADRLLGDYAWYLNVSDDRTWPVAMLKPNGFGLFDMLGNVQEWCQEAEVAYAPSLGFLSEDEEDTEPVNDSVQRLLRGGSFGLWPRDVRSACRGRSRTLNRYNNTGFRIARTYDPARQESPP